ncbi:MAG: hypothetical protein IJZ91_03080 [Oscillospiraceae bacterium]|nr:hypothetical protein [Oscillospiraceae bacterium]
MKNIIMLCLVLGLCLALCACTVPSTSAPADTPVPADTPAVTGMEETAAAVSFLPLPSTIDMSAIENCTLAVSYNMGETYVDDAGQMRMKLTVYDYEHFDLVDVSRMKPGDTILLNCESIVVESLERDERGYLHINGDIDQGGHVLAHNESGVFYETGYNDAKSFYPLGTVELPVSPDFVFTDAFDMDNEPRLYYPGDFLDPGVEMMPYFVPGNTSVVISDAYITAMDRVYMP